MGKTKTVQLHNKQMLKQGKESENDKHNSTPFLISNLIYTQPP